VYRITVRASNPLDANNQAVVQSLIQ